jgi:hypothetical protein
MVRGSLLLGSGLKKAPRFSLNPMCVFPTTEDETCACKNHNKSNLFTFLIFWAGEIKNNPVNQGSNSAKQKEKSYQSLFWRIHRTKLSPEF